MLSEEVAYRRHNDRDVRIPVWLDGLCSIDFPSPSDRALIRNLSGLTQGDVAFLVGAEEYNVSRWEHGVVPRGVHAVRYWLLLTRIAKEML